MNGRSGGNRRRLQRIGFDCPATVTLRGAEHATRLLDVSLRGALILWPGAWNVAPGDPVTLRVELAPPQAIIAMDCTVAHVGSDSLGLYCERIDLASVAHLRRVVELNLGDPELLQRELAALSAPS